MTRNPWEQEVLVYTHIDDLIATRYPQVGHQPSSSSAHPNLQRVRRGVGDALISAGEWVAGRRAASRAAGPGHATSAGLLP